MLVCLYSVLCVYSAYLSSVIVNTRLLEMPQFHNGLLHYCFNVIFPSILYLQLTVGSYLFFNWTLLLLNGQFVSMPMSLFRPLLGSHTVSVRAFCNGRRVCRLSVPRQVSKTKRDRREIQISLLL